MKVTKAHKIRLNPTPEQERYFWQAASVARYCFNWGLAHWNLFSGYNWRVNQAGIGDTIPISGRLLKKRFNAVKAEHCPWVNEVTCWASQGAFDDLQAAFSRYFDRKKKGNLITPKGWQGRKDGKPFGYPHFKSKYKATPTFYLANTALKFGEQSVLFDKHRVGWVNMTEPLRFCGKVLGGRISYYANHWWLSVQVEMEHQTPQHNNKIIGVDLGIKHLATTSEDPEPYENPKAYERMRRKLRRLQRSFSRMEKDGANWHKMKKRIEKVHYRIACIRNDASHKMTSEVTEAYGIIGLEDLNVRGMLKNGKLSKAIADAAFFEKRRQFTYKAEWQGGQVVVIDRWFPSSKRCKNCGTINSELKLSQREWICEGCGAVLDRDGNAACNIRDEAARMVAGVPARTP